MVFKCKDKRKRLLLVLQPPWWSESILSVVGCVLLVLLGRMPTTMTSNGNGLPCLYEGHLMTDKSWYGYLANITIMTSGAMIYEFSYPADKCCENILFYSDSQVPVFRSRMNCFQKEDILRPEEDSILRLTPRFSWSGCRMTHPNSIPTLVCSGGRSFSSVAYENKPTTWYVGVSNCVGLKGLDLKYKLEIYGHIGDCQTSLTTALSTTTQEIVPSPKAVLVRPDETPSKREEMEKNEQICVLEGELNVTSNWYGFIANITLNKGGGFRFFFTYPYEMQIENVILYSEHDVEKISAAQSCWQKDGIIRSRNTPDQILDLSFLSSWNGCVSKNTSQGRILTCQGERRYEHPRKLYIAVSNCRSLSGVFLDYRLEVTGFKGDLCSHGSSVFHHSIFSSFIHYFRYIYLCQGTILTRVCYRWLQCICCLLLSLAVISIMQCDKDGLWPKELHYILGSEFRKS